jgi:hypothetical protein
VQDKAPVAIPKAEKILYLQIDNDDLRAVPNRSTNR